MDREGHEGNLECTVAQVDSEEDQTPSSTWESGEIWQVVPCNATCIEWLLYVIILCLCTCILPTHMSRHQVPEKSKESTGFPELVCQMVVMWGLLGLKASALPATYLTSPILVI